jgi:hypothetical protein
MSGTAGTHSSFDQELTKERLGSIQKKRGLGEAFHQRPKQRKERQDVFRNESKVFNF